MSFKSIISLLLLSIICNSVAGQTEVASRQIENEYNSIEEALKNPDKVYRLDLSNQNINIPGETWAKFTKLEYLSLKNDHLSEIPEEIGFLKSLRILDLSGNDFVTLPQSFRNLTNLEYLSLKNDHLKEIPEEISFLRNLKTLDLSGNEFKSLPRSFRNLTNLEEIFLNDEKRFVLNK
ncbi:MAG: hypothetical protein QMB24_15915, partial [Spirosomataceae bacterium]